MLAEAVSMLPLEIPSGGMLNQSRSCFNNMKHIICMPTTRSEAQPLA